MNIRTSLLTRRIVDIPAGAVGIRETGSGRPVVFLHGLVANGLVWRNVVPRLARQARCIAPDLPLGSHSPALPGADLTLPGQARIVVETMDALGVDRAVLVGNGYGGDVAQVVAAHHQDRVDALVLIAVNSYDSDPWPTKVLRGLSAPPGAGTLQAMLMRRRAFQRLPFTYGWVAKRPIPDDVMASYLTSLWTDPEVRRDFHRFLRGLSPRHLTEAADRLTAFDRPALFVWPADERVFPLAGARRLAGSMPHAQWVSVPDSYSWIPEDQPAVLAGLLDAFLGELSSASP